MSSFNFQLPVPDDLGRFAEQQAKRLGLPSAAAYLLELLRRARDQVAPNGQGPSPTKPGADPFAFVDDLARSIPDDELRNLPTDGSINSDHYLYGHSKRDPA